MCPNKGKVSTISVVSIHKRNNQNMRRDGRMLLWMNNCSIHDVESVREAFTSANIKNVFFAPNLTSKAQPLDLVREFAFT